MTKIICVEKCQTCPYLKKFGFLSKKLKCGLTSKETDWLTSIHSVSVSCPLSEYDKDEGPIDGECEADSDLGH